MFGSFVRSNAAEKIAALDALRSNVMLADEKLNITYMNKTLVRLMEEAEVELKKELPRFSVAKLIGSNIDIFHKNPAHQRGMLAKLEKPHAATIRVGGRVFDLMVIPIINGGKRTGFAVEWADAKERLLNVDYSAQIAAIGRSQAIVELAVDGTIISANNNFLAAMGYTLEDIKGKHHRMFVETAHGDGQEYQDMWRKLNSGEFVGGEFKRIRKDRKEVWIQGFYNPIFDHNNKITKVVKFATDITERVLAVNEIGAGLTRLAEADLSHKIDKSFGTAFEKLKSDFNLSVEKLGATLHKVLESVGAITSAGREISSASDDLSRRTEHQAASLEETAAAMEEVTVTVRKTAEGAKHARNVVAETQADTERSGEIVNRTVGAMGKIEKSSQEISQIIGVIDEIAFQTNLLALNAGVEAARAGEAGRGFAVVASEVRALAQRAADAAKQIKVLITTSNSEVGNGVKLVAETGAALTRIASKVAEINTVVNDIAQGAQEQATSLQEVNLAVNDMDQSTQQNAAMAEQATAACHSLSKETDNLSDLLAQFKLPQSGGAVSMRRELERVAPHAFRSSVKAPTPPARTETHKSPGHSTRPAAKKVANGAPMEAANQDDWNEF